MSKTSTPRAAQAVSVSDARQHLADVTRLLKDGDTLGASLALARVEKFIDALAQPEQPDAAEAQPADAGDGAGEIQRLRTALQRFLAAWETDTDGHGAASHARKVLATPAQSEDSALLDWIEQVGDVRAARCRIGFRGPVAWDVEVKGDKEFRGDTLRDALRAARQSKP